jgi:hypothetical protein
MSLGSKPTNNHRTKRNAQTFQSQPLPLSDLFSSSSAADDLPSIRSTAERFASSSLHPSTTNAVFQQQNLMNMDFSSTGKVLTQEETERARKLNGYCPNCGKQTHSGYGVTLTKRKITNLKLGVWKGICIGCNPQSIPRDVMMEHENSKRSDMLLQAKKWNGGSDDTAGSDGSSVPTPKFSKVAAQAFADARKKVHLKRTTRNKVVESWDSLKDDLQGLGTDFFIQMFKDYPHLRELFPFGPDIVTEADMRASKMLQHHALMAMEMLGRAAVRFFCFRLIVVCAERG